jgi:2-(1,2-epoxy-1,2-dihydrophenyl)acetyl-CoA isomerase
MEIASQLTDMVPDSLVTTRRLMRDAASLDLSDALLAEQEAQGRLGRTSEHREGVLAFVEKRKADFRSARA